MKRKNLIIVLLIIIIIVLSGLLIWQNLKLNENNKLKEPDQEQNNNEQNQDVSDKNDGNDQEQGISNQDDNNYSLIGKYVVTYTDSTPNDVKGNVPSELILNQDNTFNFKYNNCDDFYTATGTFEINGNKLVLSNLSKPINSNNTIIFTIVSNNEIYLNTFIGCIIDDKAFENGYGSFKKVD